MSITTRREFLIASAPLLAAPLLLPVLSTSVKALGTQPDWRRCEKCYLMFWNGYADKGRCPAGGGHLHQMVKSNFHLQHGENLRDNRNAQINWRYCDKCHAMFFDGYPAKGVCSAGGGHHAQGFKFQLPHSIDEQLPGNGLMGAMGRWRFCAKCSGLFWNGDRGGSKGRCSGGGGHAAAGYSFVLPYTT